MNKARFLLKIAIISVAGGLIGKIMIYGYFRRIGIRIPDFDFWITFSAGAAFSLIGYFYFEHNNR